MTEIKLTKRYPHSRTEDITDAFMRGYEQGKRDGLEVGKQIVLGAFETYITADRKTEPLDKDINVRSKTEPQRGCDADCNEDCTECAKEWQDWKDQMWTEAVEASKTEPQTEREGE